MHLGMRCEEKEPVAFIVQGQHTRAQLCPPPPDKFGLSRRFSPLLYSFFSLALNRRLSPFLDKSVPVRSWK